MSTSKNRRLAAILFADIVGYTALMQKDEQRASKLLRHFQQQLEVKIQEHNGQIVNFYGDGALCTFQIPIDAVRCAMALQTTFQNELKTPVRIGIHSGTVTYEGEKIFGDSVNITSRIESMGIAGGVLLSKKVRDEVKNNPDLKMQSLGSFEFKNVEEPMEVYALANEGFIIPQRREMKGKLAKTTANSKRPIFIAAIIGLLTIFALWFGLSQQQTTTIPDDKSIAVLPFKDLSQQQDQEYFSDGVAEEILNALSKLEDLKVAGRISSFSFKDKPTASISEIGQQLKVSTILNGSIRKNGNQIRVTASLINTADGFQIWSEVYDEELKDIFSVQERIAQNIVQKFKLTQNIQEGQSLLGPQTSNLVAYDHYLKGKSRINKGIDGVAEAEQAFKQAIKLDSSYAAAYAGLAEVYWAHAIYGLTPVASAFEKMKNAGAKANVLDDQNATAYHWLGYYYCFYKQDWLLGLDYLHKAIAIDEAYEPGYRTAIMTLQPTPNNVERAVKAMEKKVAKDLLSIDALIDLNRINLWAKRYDKVIENVQKVFELNPTQRSTMRHISEAYLFSGQPEKALPYTQQTIQSNNYGFCNYILSLVMLEREEEAKTHFLEKKDSLDAFDKAYSYFALNEPDQGFKWLEQARLDRDPKVIFFKVDSHLDAYRQDARYKAFEAKMNFPKALKD